VRDVAEALLRVLEGGSRGALATVVRTSGSTPQQPGARLLLEPGGTLVGTVGGGAIEEFVVQALRAAVRTGQGEFVTKDLGRDLGMCCGGRMEIFVELVEAAPRLYVFGAGHIARPTASLARTVGFDVTVVDARTELAQGARFPDCTLVQSAPTEFLESLPLGERDWVLIVTHDHRLDGALLELACKKRPFYIGLVGSKRKVFRLAGNVAERLGDAALERVYAPVGLDLGARTPEEIAVSVVSELVALRRGGQAVHLRAIELLPLKKAAGATDTGPPKRRLAVLPSSVSGSAGPPATPASAGEEQDAGEHDDE
jgi:xanthine dehydrogenase accessory factor